MKRETLFLRTVIFLIGTPILGLCLFLLYKLPGLNPAYASLLYPVLIIMLMAALPFFYALYQTLKLLSYIDKNIAFSDLSVKSLKSIKFCAIAISALYALNLPFLFRLAEADDAPGALALGLVIAFASVAIAVFAAVLQKLLENAIEIKAENDLTV
jgi:cellulose synthase/poly-beta-1,6-N-acetylglucosamine synthase-like glycosyltransferase